MWVGVLGPAVVRDPSDPERAIPLKAAKHRALLAALALHPGRPVSADVLVEALWGPDAPESAHATLHTYLSVVRRTLEPELAPRAASRFVTSSDAGYQLQDVQLDSVEFTERVSAVHAALGTLAQDIAPTAGDPAAAASRLAELDAALALWRGDPYADVVGEDLVQAERSRLAELRVQALEDRATLLVAAGQSAVAVGELEALVAEHPLRERLWVLLAVALNRVGRQADALAALERLRKTLDRDLGIQPSPAVREAQTAILRQQEGMTAPAAATPSAPVDLVVPDWPFVGREAELQTLEELLRTAGQGTPSFAAIVGEPGAGKSRISSELGLRARAAGATVLVGRCSPDEDAPPLWPWRTALGDPDLGADAPDADHDAARFAVAERIRTDLVARAEQDPVVLLLEDLHWADASSLRVLRHLAAHLDLARLLVLCTWRRGSETANPALGEAAEALARRHATHVELSGLGTEAAFDVLRAVAGDRVDEAAAAATRERTEGNPFFLIEYARLARDEGQPLGELVGSTPRTVSDVVRQRVRQLPEASRDALTAGAVIGRVVDLELLAPALEVPETTALDLLEPAMAIDLVQDLGADRFLFGHALVRDTVYGELGPSRRERMHATLATLLEARPDAADRAAEIARHWAAAGSRHVDKAWRSAAAAGRAAMAVHAGEESAAHFASALSLLEQDPTGTREDRYELLVGYAEACRWSTRMVEMTAAADEAIAIAADLGRPDLLVAASEIEYAGAVWQIRTYGTVNEDVVRAIRQALETVGRDDSPIRCRLLLGLAAELYYAGMEHEIDALVEEGIALARRLGDTALLVDALQSAYVSAWRRSTIHERVAMAEESVRLAQEIGDERTALVGRFLLAAARCALGEIDGLDDELLDVETEARSRRMYFLEMATLGLEISWAALRGDMERHEVIAARLRELDDVISMAHKSDGLVGALLIAPLWNDVEAPTELVETYLGIANVPVWAAYVVLLLRKGDPGTAREIWDGVEYEVGRDSWYSEMNWALGAEIALAFGETDIAAQVYERLLPWQGTMLISGTGPCSGPIDAYLALAAAAVGEADLATTHAEAALELCETWDVPQVVEWFDDLRERHGF
ncbi:BTAD domain-containing putative transcriptional regulator [Aeromicrobium terrae]|uniref:OmpR/PhoB-type domain-containing protein n=1 Tax=Aeromicrobium terrae TaxID=2498846 RepID=A0A5C8NID5_9ACTN|nr:BTAD domain-containing putative transcriptional regulator [Aeromicrobium terrae]TXL61539.1 hypothetical protein FHP06_08960 [Aeromicrobium terrae]